MNDWYESRKNRFQAIICQMSGKISIPFVQRKTKFGRSDGVRSNENWIPFLDLISDNATEIYMWYWRAYFKEINKIYIEIESSTFYL